MMPRKVIRLARRFQSLTPDERRLIVEAFILTAVVRVGLRTVSFARLRRFLDAGKRLRSRSQPAVGRVTWAVDAAARLAPRRTCLADALAADVMLGRHGYDARLRIGVKKGHLEPGLLAHAWVEHDGSIVVGGLESLHDYSPLI
jgi:hypothetical protein